ncbi:hypothetical protein HBH56_084320 [Parastagonospora nodorum]|uniref:Uncharacterized protein n=1 Tax=Phaeosphaeria nodorum (strain SN15 / ATCC MYA-4574 / FGSC 10173) TaxID=321614 RepID=A0A7U2I1Z9_PHANO|nr:hypothetical protein HBH56_084320 [Parastagonospora nodorum]QRC96811.1 hypothetical protein JI435_434120 [Parastagonospora nodorum SN15]KAH3930049.1 hypothetical protein HBH54_117500 [Parastagonospora nodorum]KAH3955845.1 hypothetical protein HBH53_007060 [Parastagonospora nodorum]KAH3976804.1 hypothetical protein HBH51_074430 [Parastagonospora nodorum]
MLSQLTSPLSLSLLLLPLSSAAPLSSSERSLNFPPTPATNTCTAGTGTPGAFYMCPDANFGSSSKIPCQYVPANGVCMSFPVEFPELKPRSFGPDIGGVCDFYKEASCKGEIVRQLECPGLSDMGDRGWFGSVRCRAKFELSKEAGGRG